MEAYSTNVIASEMGVPPETVVNWAEEFHIPCAQSEDGIQFQAETVNILRTIKALKDSNSGFNTIRRKISVNYPDAFDSAPASGLPALNLIQRAVEESVEKKFIEIVEQRLIEMTDVSEKYAQANYTVGILTAQAQAMEDLLLRYKAQLKLLPTPDQWEQLSQRDQQQQQEIQALQQRIQELEQTLTQLEATIHNPFVDDAPPSE